MTQHNLKPLSIKWVKKAICTQAAWRNWKRNQNSKKQHFLIRERWSKKVCMQPNWLRRSSLEILFSTQSLWGHDPSIWNKRASRTYKCMPVSVYTNLERSGDRLPTSYPLNHSGNIFWGLTSCWALLLGPKVLCWVCRGSQGSKTTM
jgi:hypothetical protein